MSSPFAQKRSARYSNSLTHVRNGTRVVVLRTFSKAHGLAGLRIGYGLGPPELMSYCARMRPTFSVSSLAESAALAALEDAAHISHTVESNATQAELLTKGLSALGYRVIPTWANFIYCDLGQNAAEFGGRLRGEGISVRPLGPWGATNCIRISIGAAEQNQIFLGAIRKIASAESSR
jgi:histidinol-phosphate aminotransferase